MNRSLETLRVDGASGRTPKDLSGQRFGKLLVRGVTSGSRNSGIRWDCICDCGNVKELVTVHLTRKTQPVRSCGCISKSRVGFNHPQWKGCGEISGDWFDGHVTRHRPEKSKRPPLEIDVTIEFLWELFLKQERRCALTDFVLSFPIKGGDTTATASLDRIDSSRGYTKDNVQFVHKHINRMKNVYSQETFLDFCRAVAKNHPAESDLTST